MAQRTVSLYLCDKCGASTDDPSKTVGVHVVYVTAEGTFEVELDLCPKCQKLQLQPLVDVSRDVPRSLRLTAAPPKPHTPKRKHSGYAGEVVCDQRGCDRGDGQPYHSVDTRGMGIHRRYAHNIIGGNGRGAPLK